MTPPLPSNEELFTEVCANPRYARMDPGLTRALIELEAQKGRNAKEVIKAVRNKLHQVGGAYQEKLIDYAKWKDELVLLPHDLRSSEMQAFCRAKMVWHTSTQERLPLLESFYSTSLAGIAPIHSLLDLACGLNPLTYPWLPLADGASLQAYDIYSDQAVFLNAYFQHTGLSGQAGMCDLTRQVPAQPVQLAMLLKTIPCLEQIDKTIGKRLLTQINADHLLVSFPSHSLSGKGKGMRQNYAAHFQEITAGLPFTIQNFEFSGELVFLLTRIPPDPEDV